jgi:hypothetical protein
MRVEEEVREIKREIKERVIEKNKTRERERERVLEIERFINQESEIENDEKKKKNITKSLRKRAGE